MQYWREEIDGSILIDCNVLSDLDSQVGQLVRRCKSIGIKFPRYDLLWTIRKRVLDGIEPAADENRKWLVDAVSLIPVVGGVVDFGAKVVDVGKKLRGHLSKTYGELNSWFLKELGENWEGKLIHILWSNPNEATLLLMNAVQTDLNSRESVETLVIMIDNIDTQSTRKWNLDGQAVGDPALWHKVISGIQACVGVTAGRNALDNSWSTTVGVDQHELTELDVQSRQDLYHSRNFNDSDLRRSVDRICQGHPFMMQLVIDAVEKYQLTKADLDNIKSESLDIARTELWKIFFSQIGQLTEVLDRAALLPFFNRDIRATVAPSLKTKDWMDFKSLSFVIKQDDNYWTLHDLAKELVIAELDSRIVEDTSKILFDRFQDNDDPLYYGLSISLHEFISVETASRLLDRIIVDFRLQNKSDYTLRALEGVRFRGRRLQGLLGGQWVL